MIKNSEGLVALKYHQPIQKFVSDVPSKTSGYVFQVKANIAMAWVQEIDVPNILSRTKTSGCCGAKKAPAFSYANENDVRQWTNNGGR